MTKNTITTLLIATALLPTIIRADSEPGTEKLVAFQSSRASTAQAEARPTEMAGLIDLLSWAAHLSRYPKPTASPELQYKPHRFFVDNACAGRECAVIGWYNDGGVIYVDEALRSRDSLFVSSLIVHELVHYLQHVSGEYSSDSCADSVHREREAYEVQRGYIVAHGTLPLVRTHHRACQI